MKLKMARGMAIVLLAFILAGCSSLTESGRIELYLTDAPPDLNIEKALVMVNSKVAAEAAFHLTNALSAVTGIGQGAMTVLKDNGLV